MFANEEAPPFAATATGAAAEAADNFNFNFTLETAMSGALSGAGTCAAAELDFKDSFSFG